MSRRRLLILGGGVAGATGLGLAGCTDEGGATDDGTGGTGDPSPQVTSDGVCRLTTEATEGPYYLDVGLIREDVTEGKSGTPLTLRVNVVDAVECGDGDGAIGDAAVEIWHCDAWGYYSGFVTNSPGGDGPTEDGVGDENTFLRGVQVTDDEGNVEFTTIVPGWYLPRTAHVHVKVHLGGTVEDTHYEGGETVHTGQFFFPDDVIARLYQSEPYSAHTGEYTALDDDTVYTGDGATGGLLSLEQVSADDPSAGLIGSITVGVDPEHVSDGGGGPDGEGPGGDGPGGPPG